MTYCCIRKFFWVDTMDVLANGLVNAGVVRLLLRSASNDCKYQSIRAALVHTKHQRAVSATMFRPDGEDFFSKGEQ